eukprot:GHVT01072588.1.p1 GENE.GHVT01072588.1~~GHVT01072588.1.p1  ORF type:complete len:223 (-),score=51.18 GHVT01072588.1:234-902(-)
MQLSCPELGTKDRVVVQYVIKDLSSSSPGAAFLQGTGPAYRVFLFQDAETMSEGAQAGLRRTLERFVRNARVILLVDQLSCIISPVRSRCLCIRVPLPTPTEVLSVLRDTCTKENLSPAVVPDAFLQRLVERSECNVRRALVLLEGAAEGGCDVNAPGRGKPQAKETEGEEAQEETGGRAEGTGRQPHTTTAGPTNVRAATADVSATTPSHTHCSGTSTTMG